MHRRPLETAAGGVGSTVDAPRLPFGHRDRTLGVLAAGGEVGEHVHHNEVGDGGGCLLAQRARPPGVSVRLETSRYTVRFGSAVQTGLAS